MDSCQEPSVDSDKLSYEIFSILESKFLFGYDWKPKQVEVAPPPAAADDSGGVKNQRGKVCVISIDGGGMRGILAGKTLAYLENALKARSGDPNATIADYFDVAAGSGVGGVFTAMLFGSADRSRPIFKAEETWRFLAEQGSRIYTKRSKNDGGFLTKLFRGCNGGGAGFGNAMREAFTVAGRSLTLKDTLKPVLIPCYDLSTAAPFLFSRADALAADGFDFRLWEVCRATTAEPDVFGPVPVASVDGKTRCLALDGGLAMSNPTAAAITHVLHNKEEFPFVRGVEDLLVLSVGSGQLLEGNYDYEKVKGWKAKEWARPIARISGDSSADMVDHAVAMAFGHSRCSNYVRIQANGSTTSRLVVHVDSDPSPSNVRTLTGIADEMLRQKTVESVLFGGKTIGGQTNLEKLDWFAGELVLERQRRSCRVAPTVAFKQAAAAAVKPA